MRVRVCVECHAVGHGVCPGAWGVLRLQRTRNAEDLADRTLAVFVGDAGTASRMHQSFAAFSSTSCPSKA